MWPGVQLIGWATFQSINTAINAVTTHMKLIFIIILYIALTWRVIQSECKKWLQQSSIQFNKQQYDKLFTVLKIYVCTVIMVCVHLKKQQHFIKEH